MNIVRPTLLLTALLALVTPAALRAQVPEPTPPVEEEPVGGGEEEEPEKKEPDPEIERLLDEFLEAARDRKQEHDPEAIQRVEEILARGPDFHPKDRQDILRGLKRAFGGRSRSPENPELYQSVIRALGQMGDHDAAVILESLYELSVLKDDEWQSTREEILEQIGVTKDERMVDFLLEEATRPPQEGINRAGGYALRHFGDSEFPQRRAILRELVKRYRAIAAEATPIDPTNTVARVAKRRLAAISDAWNTTLKAVSGQNFRTADEWNHWWNKHKNRPDDWR